MAGVFAAPSSGPAAPERDCRRCPRLAAFRDQNRSRLPGYYNAPVPSFGDPGGRLLIVGLAPGLHGANRTGRPFTGDHAGMLLFDTLRAAGFAQGSYGASPDDGLRLVDCRIANAARCVPPANRPTPEELRTCLPFLAAEIEAMPRLRAIVALGLAAHASTLRALGRRAAAHPFAHGAVHPLDDGLTLFDSYHCSRQNTNTGRLTAPMFEAVFARIRAALTTG